MKLDKDRILKCIDLDRSFFEPPIFNKPIEDMSESEFIVARDEAKERLEYLVSVKRHAHSVSVAELCMEVALVSDEKYRLQKFKAYFAGLLHDCAKGISKKKALKLMSSAFPDYVNQPHWAHHQFLGAILAEALFGMTDNDVLEAIKFHATGKKDMTSYQKLVYACDKIDPLRGYDSRYMIDAMKEDIDKGFVFVLSENLKFYGQEGFVVDDPFANECFLFYLGHN